jgi:glutamate-1-semialdehyde 2,1-aminomutase
MAVAVPNSAADTERLLQRACRVMPGGTLGVSLLDVDAETAAVARGHGAHLFDRGGRRYVDLLQGGGTLLLGHASPTVRRAIEGQLRLGTTYSSSLLSEPAVALAERIVDAVACAEQVRLVSTGGEATFAALRLARAVTGRPRVMKFEGGYHGGHDLATLSVKPARPLALPAPTPDYSDGLIPGALESLLVAPYNDLPGTERIIAAHADELAAVIVSPQQRGIEPAAGFLQGLRALTRRHGILLVFDEVVTGFRLGYGGAQERYGVVPDLAAYGKALGGGLPIGALAGPAGLMAAADPIGFGTPGHVYVAGTHAGNPLSAAAGIAVLDEMRTGDGYAHLERLAARLRNGLTRAAAAQEVPLVVNGDGILFVAHLASTPINTYRDLLSVDSGLQLELTRELARRGVIADLKLRIYLSTAHTDHDIDLVIEAFDGALTAMRARGELTSLLDARS